MCDKASLRPVPRSEDELRRDALALEEEWERLMEKPKVEKSAFDEFMRYFR
jgi:hypothetical protein